jgi:hypothetical protein
MILAEQLHTITDKHIIFTMNQSQIDIILTHYLHYEPITDKHIILTTNQTRS